MKKYKEGFRRLSIAFGILGVIAWIIFFLKEGGFGDLDNVRAWEWILLVVLTFVAYLIPYFFVKGIYWILSGFSQKNNNHE